MKKIILLSGKKEAPELITNGTFDIDTTGWSQWTDSVLSVIDGRMNCAPPGSPTFTGFGQSIVTEVGKTYEVSFYVDVLSGVRTNLRVGSSYLGHNNILDENTTNFTSGTYAYEFTATTTTTWVVLANYYNSSTIQYDNVSVKQIL